MKKTLKNLLVLSVVGCGLVLASCSSVQAKPNGLDDKLVNFTNDNTEYFRNSYELLFENYLDAGSSSSTILTNLINIIAETELPEFYGSQAAFEAEVEKKCKQKLIDKVKDGAYDVDSLFQEEKLVKELANSLHNVYLPEGKTYNNDYLILPDVTVDDFAEIFHADYSDYFKKNYRSSILKELLTAKYMCENQFNTLGRAQARDVSYIKIEKIDEKPSAVSSLITDWLSQYIDVKGNEVKTVDSELDLESLARIWKGVDLTGAEATFASTHYSLNKQLEERIAKIADYDSVSGVYTMKDDADIDTAIEDEFTGSGAYTINWGKVLKQRELVKKDFTGSDLYTKSEGISDLPSVITNRVFSTSVASYIKTVKYKVGDEEKEVRFLTPATSENDSTLSKYYHFDSSTNAYYIVLVNDYNFSSTALNEETTEVDGKKVYGKNTKKIAEQLGESSSNQREAVIKYLKKYQIADNVHDQDFYEYLENNYSEIFDDK
ncbi:MAG: hypothetical protein PUA88_07865 [Bacillales bacterium]|nr:hypothetical protein [Bacillales bacterium]